MIPEDIVTKQDLELFKQELFALLGKPQSEEQFGWLKNAEVRKLFGVSNGTLQTLRVNGSLPFSKIGGLYFYKRVDIEKMLEGAEKKKPESEVEVKTLTFSLRYFLKPAKNNERDWRWIYARLTVDGERLDFSIQRKCKPGEWDGQRVKGSKEEARSINHWLDTLQLKAHAARQELYVAGKPFRPKQVRRMMQGGPLEEPQMVSEAWAYHMDYIAGLIGKDYSEATLQKYKAGKKAFYKFLKLKLQKDDIALNEPDHAFIKNYEFYLKTEHGVQNNTAIQIIKRLRTVVKIAMDFGWLQRDPFIAHRMKSTEVHRTFLSSDELQRLATKKLDSKLGEVRDLFLFSCYTGLAFTDMIKLEADDLVTDEDGETRLQTHRTKNNNRVRVPLLAPAQKLLDTYKDHPRTPEGKLMPRISNQKANAYLKLIADKAHINKHLTYHCARHTFATTVN